MAHRVLLPFDFYGVILPRDHILTARQEQALGASLLTFSRRGWIAEVSGAPAEDPPAPQTDDPTLPPVNEGQAYEIARDGVKLMGQFWPAGQRITAKMRNALLKRSVPAAPVVGLDAPQVEALLTKMVRDGDLRPVPGPCARRAEMRVLTRGAAIAPPRTIADSEIRAAQQVAQPSVPARPQQLPLAPPPLPPAPPEGESAPAACLRALADGVQRSGDEILAAAGARHGKGAIASALSRLMRAGKIVRVMPGVYQAAAPTP